MTQIQTPMTELNESGFAARMAWLPINAFVITMGLTGLALAWHQLASQFVYLLPAGLLLTSFSSGLFLLFLIAYVRKWLFWRERCVAEWRHPVFINLFAAVSISFCCRQPPGRRKPRWHSLCGCWAQVCS